MAHEHVIELTTLCDKTSNSLRKCLAKYSSTKCIEIYRKWKSFKDNMTFNSWQL